MIVAVPFATAVTTPSSSTVATEASSDVHAKAALAIALPFASRASADRRSASLSALNMPPSGDTITALTSWATVTAALPEAEPAVALIVAVPFASAVTCPEASTAATEASLLAHATGAPAITCPFWSRTSAVNRAVSPREVSEAEAGLTATVVATGTGGGDGSTPASPQDRSKVAIPATTVAEFVKLALNCLRLWRIVPPPLRPCLTIFRSLCIQIRASLVTNINKSRLYCDIIFYHDVIVIDGRSASSF